MSKVETDSLGFGLTVTRRKKTTTLMRKKRKRGKKKSARSTVWPWFVWTFERLNMSVDDPPPPPAHARYSHNSKSPIIFISTTWSDFLQTRDRDPTQTLWGHTVHTETNVSSPQQMSPDRTNWLAKESLTVEVEFLKLYIDDR